MPRSFVRGVQGWIYGFDAVVILEVGDLRWSGLVSVRRRDALWVVIAILGII